MTTLSEFPTTDLILRVSGGSRDGELIPVNTPKCYLGMEATNEAVSKNPHCVIFRGSRGVVVRSYADQVMFNDSSTSLHWLEKGDTIKLPNAMKFEVVQLGEVKDIASKATQTDESTGLQTDSRLVVLESELRSIQLQSENSETRFDQLDSRLNMLAEKMTMLIDMSSNGTGAALGQVSTPQTTGLTADSSAEPQTLQNKALAVDVIEAVESVDQANESDVQADVKAEEASQSPVSASPLDELNRIDQAIEESVTSGYSSQNDDSEEQILTFNGESTDSTESVDAEDAVVVEDQIVTTTENTTSSTDETDSTEEDSVEEAETAADAKATTDEAEKESRLSEMERIFGGIDSADETTEQSSDAELAQTEEIAETFDAVVTNQPADEQLSQTFKDLTHGPNAEVDSSADNSLSAESAAEELSSSDVSTESDDQPEAENMESGLSPMALQLLQDVKADQTQEEAQVETEDSASSSEPVESETPVETIEQPKLPVRAEPETLIVPERRENESVAELLARMQEDGKWDGVIGDDDPVEPVEPVQTTPEPEPTESSLDSSADESADGQGEDVDLYMSNLLSRMRGEEPAAAVTEVKKDKKPAKEKAKKEVEKPKFEAPADPLKAEDFKPKQKAKKLKSLDAMRELANSNARTNVKVSETNNRKAKAFLSAGVGVGALLMSLFYFLFTSQALIGVVCLVMAAVCGASLYKNLKSKNGATVKKQKEPVQETTEA